IGRTLPYHRVALASFTGYAFSHTLGFGSLIGPSIRYRIYPPMGADRRRGRRNVSVRDRHVYDRARCGLSSGGAAGSVVSRDARNIAACRYRDRDAWFVVDGGLRRIRLVDGAADPIVPLPAPPSAAADRGRADRPFRRGP